jgi:hypothetical protein
VVVAHHAEDPGLTADLELAAVSWANGPVPHAATARA